MGNQPTSTRVEVITYEEPVPPPPEIEVDVRVDEYGNVETETVLLQEPHFVEPVVIETISEPEIPPYIQPDMQPYPYIEGNPNYRPYIETEVLYDPSPQPVVIDEYYTEGGADVEVTTYPYDGNPAGYVDYGDDGPYPDTEPYYSEDFEPYP